MRHGHQLGAVAEHPLILVETQLSGVGDGDDLELRPLLVAHHLPGHDVGVVLHGGDDDLVSGPEVFPSVALGHEVDPLRGPPGEHDFVIVGRVQEPSHPVPAAIVGLGRHLAEEMDAPMHVGVLLGVIPGQGVNDDLGLLRGRGVVQVHEGFAVHLDAQGRKVLADLLGAEPDQAVLAGLVRNPLVSRLHHRSPSKRFPCGSHWATSRSRCARTGSIFIRWSMSPAKAYSKRARADASPMPRERR